MRRFAPFLAALLLVAVLAGSLYFPRLAADASLRQQLEVVHLEQQEEQEAPATRSLAEKLRLVLGEILEDTNKGEALFSDKYMTGIAPNLVALSTGNQFDGETIKAHCLEELKKLQDSGLLPIAPQGDAAAQAQPYLYLSQMGQTTSVIVWHLYFDNAEPFISVALDDETGKVISFRAPAINDRLDEEAFRRYGDYLGLTLDKVSTQTNKVGATFYIAAYQDESGTPLLFPAVDFDGFRSFGLPANTTFIQLSDTRSVEEYMKRFSIIDAKP